MNPERQKWRLESRVCLHAAGNGLNVWSRKCSQQWQNCWWICAWTTTERTLLPHFVLKRL